MSQRAVKAIWESRDAERIRAIEGAERDVRETRNELRRRVEVLKNLLDEAQRDVEAECPSLRRPRGA